MLWLGDFASYSNLKLIDFLRFLVIVPKNELSQSFLCSSADSALLQGPGICPVFHLLLSSLSSLLTQQNLRHERVFFFLLIKIRSSFLGLIWWSILSQISENFVRFIFSNRLLFVHVLFITMLQIVSCTILSRSPYPPTRVSYCILFLLHFLTMGINCLLFGYLQVFHSSVFWWFFSWFWVTASLLGFPGLFAGFWPILTMLSSKCSRLFLRCPSVLISFPTQCIQ